MKRVLNWVLVIGGVAGVVWLAGCGTTSAQRLGALRSGVAQAEAESARLDGPIGDLEGVVTQAQDRLKTADGANAEKIKAVLAEAKPRLKALREQKAKVDGVVAGWEKRIEAIESQAKASGGVNVGDEIEAWSSGLGSLGVMIPQPWGALAGAVCGLGTLIGGWWAGRERSKRKQAEGKGKDLGTALREVVSGVDSVLRDRPDVEDRATIKQALGSGQSAKTQVLVKRAQVGGV